MKRGRDGGKVVGPLFPRLHVNDSDKGGPRAPPRNKMALYELFSIPSQRFNSDAALPKQHHQAGSLLPSAHSSQGRGHERDVSSPFCAPHKPVHMAEMAHPHSVEGLNQNPMSMELERRSLKHGLQKMANTAGNARMDVECSSLHPDDMPSLKGAFGKKSGDEDDFRVPSCVQPGIALHSDKDHHSMDRERTTYFHLNIQQKNGTTAFSSQSQVQSSHSRPLERISTNSLMPQQCASSGEGKAKETVLLHMGMDGSISQPAIREKAAGPLNVHKPSSNQEHSSCKLNKLNSSQSGSARQCQESNGSFGERGCLSDAEFMEKQVISNGESESFSRVSLPNSLLEPSVAEHCNAAGEKVGGAEDTEKAGSPQNADKISPSEDVNKNGTLGDADRNDDVSKTSMVDSIPGLDICPDDVVGLIGPKHFWKARRAIANQQRVFAVQVFELHRLIEVQKLMATSPHLLVEDTYLHCSPLVRVKDPLASLLVKPQLQIKHKDESHEVNNSDCATETTESANFLVNPQVQIVKQKDESRKVNNSECATENTESANFLVNPQVLIARQEGESHKVNNSECATENTESANFLVNLQVRKDEPHKTICNSECPENTGDDLPLPCEHDRGPPCQPPRNVSCSGKVSSFPSTSDNRSGAWCFHPPGNQWLIPVMSPGACCFHPPGNQWLIPVMSPSEGLIYKPYTGPFPPSADAFMAPVYSGCGPLGVAPVAGDLMRPTIGVPMPHQQQNMSMLPAAPAVAPNYFSSPHGLPVLNPLISSSSPVDQGRSMTGPRPGGQLEQHSWSSCNMSNRKDAVPERAQKIQISDDNNDMQGSTASHPGGRPHGGRSGPPHFPIASSMECSGRRPPQADSKDHQARVIRVVPHNRRSATESAARIFRSIQKERQQHDSV